MLYEKWDIPQLAALPLAVPTPSWHSLPAQVSLLCGDTFLVGQTKPEDSTANHVFYTDGSATGGMTNGGSGVAMGFETRFSSGRKVFTTVSTRTVTGSRVCLAYDAELTGIWAALKWAIDENMEGTVIIYADCQGALRTIANPQRSTSSVVKAIIQLLSTREGRTHLEWVRGHDGNAGNELADKLAKTAARGQRDHDPPASYSAIKALIRKTIVDPPPEDPYLRAVYSRRPRALGNSRSQDVRHAKIRLNRFNGLNEYAKRIGQRTDELCPYCLWAKETTRHWMRCLNPFRIFARLTIFWAPFPDLNVLSYAPDKIDSYFTDHSLGRVIR